MTDREGHRHETRTRLRRDAGFGCRANAHRLQRKCWRRQRRGCRDFYTWSAHASTNTSLLTRAETAATDPNLVGGLDSVQADAQNDGVTGGLTGGMPMIISSDIAGVQSVCQTDGYAPPPGWQPVAS